MRVYFQRANPIVQEIAMAIAGLYTTENVKSRRVTLHPGEWEHVRMTLAGEPSGAPLKIETKGKGKGKGKKSKPGDAAEIIANLSGLVVAIAADPAMPYGQYEIV